GCAAGVMQIQTAGGETRYLDYRNSLQQKGSTEPVAYSVARDITARIRAEAAMRVSQAQVTGIIATAMDAIITTDAEQRIIIFNPAAEAMFGCSQTEARGQQLDRFIPARFRASHRLHIQRFAQTGVSARKIGQFGPVYGLRADGVEFPIEASISKIHVAGQDLFTVILRDVSAREQAAQALRRQLDTLHSLYQITALISQTEAVPEVVAAALNSLHSVLTADRSAIVLLDSAGVARFEAWRGLSDAYRRAVVGHFPWALDDPAPQPILAPDVHQDASLASLSAVFVDEGIAALAFIPLSHQGRLLGKFMIYYNTPHAFSAEEIELTQTIARHVAFAIARKQATEALAASEMQLRALFASMQDVVLVIDREGVYRRIAPTNPALLVRPAEELLGKSLRDVFPAAEAELFTDVCQAVLQTSHATHIEYELPIGDRRVWFEASISPLTDDSTLWVARDVTAHKQSAATLQRQLQALTVLHAVASACIEASDEDDLIIRLTQLVSAALALDEFGIFLLDEAGWLRPHPSYHRRDGSRVQPYRPGQGVVGQTALTGQSHRVADVRLDPDYVAATPTTLSELAVPVKIGERVIAVINAESPQLNSFSADDERLLSTLAGQVATALERLRLWQQTQEQARRVQQIVDTMPEGVLLLDAQERVVLANPTAGRDLATLAGAAVGDIITRLGDLPLTELLLPATRGPWRETSAHDRTFQMIARPIGDTSEPAAWVLVINDVTYERERQRYRQAQERLASVGQMAAGIAHDFNNIMGAIVLYSELLGKAQELTERSKHYLGVIRQQADHAANLIRQILDFSRRAPMERAPLDLLSLTKEMVKLLERTLPESIRLAVKYDQREVIVHGDPTRLQQVLMNLALNARDAMP
ncbi:MAG: PAS domain S-box protein, partial [Anaerolineae bacterium]